MRPEGWDARKILDEKFPVSNMKVTHLDTFEAGANAMYNALLAQGKIYTKCSEIGKKDSNES